MRGKKAKSLRKIIKEKFADLEERVYTKKQVISKRTGLAEVTLLDTSLRKNYKLIKKFYKNGGNV